MLLEKNIQNYKKKFYKQKINIIIFILVINIFILQLSTLAVFGNDVRVKLGNEVLLDDYYYLIDGKNVGLVT
ncbi:MAG: hypothetical protein QM220_09980, partial [Atribacterota bacterium]|nr:hypothetical protein [Atribacterota bacterium]